MLDLNGNGIELTSLSNSTHFTDSGDDGLQHRTAWAGSGDGVLFIDADGDGTISNTLEYVFTEWDATAKDDMQALRGAFDTNGDGKLTSADARFNDFKVMVTNADGSTTVQTLAQLGITEINLTADATNITLPDGSQITGQSTFVMNGVTRTAATTSLMSEVQGYRVVDAVSVDGSGNRVVVSTGYAANGERAFVITSVTSPNGGVIRNSYDIDADGVVDQLQTITTVTNSNGSRTETVVNQRGADAATAITLSRTQTTTSADGKQVTIYRDHSGGGWWDQSEVRTTAAGGARTVVISELSKSQTVITSVTETISADGQTRTTSANLDGAGGADRITTQVISTDAAGVRTEVTTVKNQNGSIVGSETEVVSADGKIKTTTQDLNGDGAFDVKIDEESSVTAAGVTTTKTWVRNADGSLQTQTNVSVSQDGLTTTSQLKLDGDADFDRTIADVTVIDATGNRTTTVTQTNTDGSIYDLTKTTLAADKVSSETWIDLNQNGVFEATDLVQSVVVNASTQVKTTTTYDRNADGSLRAKAVEITNAAGTSTTTTVDADGDGDTDQKTVDTTVSNADLTSTRTITVTNQDGTQVSKDTITTSADGLVVTTLSDVGGTTTTDFKTVDSKGVGAAGEALHSVETYAGDMTTLLSRASEVKSADRLTTTVTRDINGDGAADQVSQSTEATNGTKTVILTNFNADGSIASKSVSAISANGLVITTSQDLNGDGINDVKIVDTTTLPANGDQVRTVVTQNGDGSLRSSVQTTSSDDGLTLTTRSDRDGDGAYDMTLQSVTTIAANGTRTATVATTAADGTVLSRAQISVSDDHWVVTSRSDADGDGDYDLVQTATTVLQDNGGQITTTELRNQVGSTSILRNREVVTRSDDGRQITITRDVNGDGIVDETVSHVEADNGLITNTVTERDASGDLQSQIIRTVTGNGLISTETRDVDGDGTVDLRHRSETVYSANGSTVETEQNLASNGALINSETTTTRDDGFVITTTSDLDGNGDIEFTSGWSFFRAGTGAETVTSTLNSEDGTLIREQVTVTSSDKRSVTTTTDLDGNGVDDRVTTTVLDATGKTTSTTEYYSAGGTLDARHVLTSSEGGLITTANTDRNGDGRFELQRTDTRVLNADGSVSSDTIWHNDRNVTLAATSSSVSDNGLQSMTRLDLNGDGVFEFRSERSTELQADGSVHVLDVTFDGTSTQIGSRETTVSGNGLTTSEQSDYTGDGSMDRKVLTERTADGAWTSSTELYASGARLVRSWTTTASADGRTLDTLTDLDGDGQIDRHIRTEVDLSRNVTTTYEDFETDGDLAQRIIESRSANGAAVVVSHDYNGDGHEDLVRNTEYSVAANGDRVESYTERFTPFSAEFGIGRLVYAEQTTTSANGLHVTTTYDVDGDGVIDGQSDTDTVIAANGGRVITSQTHYADGSLRGSEVTTISADGRSSTVNADYDGNGIADKVISTAVEADGSVVETVTAFNEAGVRGQVFVTATSADGLITTILRPGAQQTILRSAADNGSYQWDNGQVASQTVMRVITSHQVDGFGVETWTATQSWLNASNAPQTATATVRLDAAAKAQIVAEAARLYDAILDRDMDVSEVEMLVTRIADGQLDRAALTTALLASSEFTTRYGTMSDGEFLNQLYFNTVNRGASLEELNGHLRAISNGSATRASISIALAESVEHVVIGNGHLATNNFDVIMNPAVFERSLDRVWVEEVVRDIVDVVYDRDATDHELRVLSEQLLKGTANADDIASQLLALSGDLQGTGSATLNGLSGSALVRQAFVNALGRQPSAAEQYAWEENLTSGRISAAQFVASLAMSVEHQMAGDGHVPVVLPTVATVAGTAGNDVLSGSATQDSISGGAGNDSLSGAAGSDVLLGGAGVDTLDGGAGGDTYRWSRGDGSDVLAESGTSLLETDTLALLDVASTAVSVSRGGAGNTSILLKVTTSGVTETIEIRNALASVTSGVGIEAIVFSNGVTWSLDDLLSRMTVNGGTGNDSMAGTGFADRLSGGLGNDSLYGGDGNDSLNGQGGVDSLFGGSGSDTYTWQGGFANDVISDTGASQTEIDRLFLSGIQQSDVALSRAGSSNDLLITVTSAAGTEVITVKDQFASATTGTGVEIIQFADGSTWTLDDIATRAEMRGGVGNNSYEGSAQRDVLVGLAGLDTLTGNAGDDTLDGGLDIDSLVGGAGGDTYLWRKGDGADVIADGSNVATEIDVLRLLNVSSGEVTLARTNGSGNLRIKIGSEEISINGQFAEPSLSTGIEQIVFADGSVWTLDDILARTKVTGDAAANTLSGLSYMDNLYGLGGNDTITGAGGDDLIVGGLGNDTVDGGIGNDRFEWSLGDGNDALSDTGASLTEVDTLALLNVASSASTLSRIGNNLVITMTSGGEAITVLNRFASATAGTGIEVIEFSDGVVKTVLNEAVAEIHTAGTTTANTLTGWGFRDLIEGLGGNDTITGAAGNDTLIGGADADSLNGGDGSDVYEWTVGHGNDIIDDRGASRTETDRLVLTNVASTAAGFSLSRAQGSWNLTITVGAEVITIKDRYVDGQLGYGIEEIQFADGVIWTLDDILANTRLNGTAGADTLLSGTSYTDNIFGGTGNDNILGWFGNDVLDGGAGVDTLYGGSSANDATNGSDQFLWSHNDGNDLIYDTGASAAETDTLVLEDVNQSDVTLTRVTGSGNLLISIAGGSAAETLTIVNQYGTAVSGAGIERIEFGDGSSWDLSQILGAVAVNGSAGNDALVGSAERDNLYGLAGFDTLSGSGGDDWLYGGLQGDSLVGGAGDDHYIWSVGDGWDTINDGSGSLTDVDTLVLSNVASSAVTLRHVSGSNDIIVHVSGSTSEDIRIVNQLADVSQGNGIERIIFADGSQWSLQDILDEVTTLGTPAAETLVGTGFDDRMFGYEGNDSLSGGAGNDDFFGGIGADTMNGGTGVDKVSYYYATQGVSVNLNLTTGQVGIAGGEEVGDVYISMENLAGSNFGDALWGNNSSNQIWGNDGNDTINGFDGYDDLDGGAGNDSINGGLGADILNGGGGNDTLYGSSGDDTVDGDHGNDRLFGDDGNDTINGDDGNDVVTGGAGEDVFVFTGSFGVDQITDFSAVDQIEIANNAEIDDFADLVAHHMTQVGADVLIADTMGNSILVKNWVIASFTEEQFVF